MHTNNDFVCVLVQPLAFSLAMEKKSDIWIIRETYVSLYLFGYGLNYVFKKYASIWFQINVSKNSNQYAHLFFKNDTQRYPVLLTVTDDHRNVSHTVILSYDGVIYYW